MYSKNLKKEKKFFFDNFSTFKRCFVNINYKKKNNVKVANYFSNLIHPNIKK